MKVLLSRLNLVVTTHKAKSFDRKNWSGDLLIANDWHLTWPSVVAKRPKIVVWKPPDPGKLKINTD